jgi:hypothetical protein
VSVSGKSTEILDPSSLRLGTAFSCELPGFAALSSGFDSQRLHHDSPQEAGVRQQARQQQPEPSQLADAFLTAVGAGDDRAAQLAMALADAVLDASGARLAVSVLEGGPLIITRAIRLAEDVLSRRGNAAKAGAS